MVTTCCVPQCNNKFLKNSGINFHRFPNQRILKKKWIIQLRLGNYPSKWFHGCSAHFDENDYRASNFGDNKVLKPGSIPSKNIPLRKFENNLRTNTTNERANRYSHRESGLSTNPTAVASQIPKLPTSSLQVTSSSEANLPNNEVNFQNNNNNESNDYAANVTSQAATQTTVQTKSKMTQTLTDPSSFIRFSNILNDQLKYFTGLDFKRFNFLASLISKENYDMIHPEIGLNDQLLLPLFKYRHDNDFIFMQNIFMINRNLISDIFKNMTQNIYLVLRQIGFWKLSKVNSLYRAIIDCTEVPVEKSENPNYHQLTFSNYKNRTTFKILIAVDENGLVIFVSEIFGGAILDREIFQKSNILNNLQRGDFVLADRGFDISDWLENKGVVLNIPPFLRGKSQLMEEEIVHTRVIANKRIIVERVIGLAKVNQILLTPMPITMWPFANQIIQNVFYLCNLHSPII